MSEDPVPNPDPAPNPPTLAEEQARVMRRLIKAGLSYPPRVAGGGLLHDLLGLGVVGVRDRGDAVPVLAVLRRMSPAWKLSSLYQNDSSAVPGWAVRISLHRDPPTEQSP